MTKTLAELRAQPQKQSRPEQSVSICLAPHLVAEVQELTQRLGVLQDELDTLPQPPVDEDGERVGPPQKLGAGPNPRAVEIRAEQAEIRARLKVLLEEMAEHEGEMRLRAGDDGVWRRWVDKNPAREEGGAGYLRDREVTGGYCNADALIETLGDYAHSWNGDPLAAGDWDAVFKDNIGGPDKKKMAQTVVALYESRLDFKQLRSGLSATLSELNAFALLETSTSAPDDSTAGSPEPSKPDTTETATESL